MSDLQSSSFVTWFYSWATLKYSGYDNESSDILDTSAKNVKKDSAKESKLEFKPLLKVGEDSMFEHPQQLGNTL